MEQKSRWKKDKTKQNLHRRNHCLCFWFLYSSCLFEYLFILVAKYQVGFVLIAKARPRALLALKTGRPRFITLCRITMRITALYGVREHMYKPWSYDSYKSDL